MNPVIKEVFDKVRNLFIYIPDAEQFPGKYDDWRSYANEVERGEIFRDDCDALSMTCAELIARSGKVLRENIRLATCFTDLNEGHAVCIADGWLLDNRQRYIYAWNDVPYRWDRSMKMSEPRQWRKML